MRPAQPSFLSMSHQSVRSRTTFSLGLGLGSWRGGRRSMGRGSVQLTFSKRRVGLLKKAHEISVLCGANVALIIFSSKGNLYEYSSDSSMDTILERYKRYSYAEKALPIKEPESQEEFCHEYGQLKRMVDALQRSQSHVMGENLDTLTLTELQQLDLQLETTLKHIRSQMNQLLLNSISELQKKETSLIEDKILLKNKIIENKKAIRMAQQMQAKEQSQDQPSSSTQPTLLLINSLSTTLPSWMFRHSS